MTKNEWIRYWREERIRQRRLTPKTLSTSNLISVLREYYDYAYLPEQEAFSNLVERYKDKISPELIQKHKRLMKIWKPEAKKRASEQMKNIIYDSNPFLKMVPKDDSFKGVYIPIPIKYS